MKTSFHFDDPKAIDPVKGIPYLSYLLCKIGAHPWSIWSKPQIYQLIDKKFSDLPWGTDLVQARVCRHCRKIVTRKKRIHS